jgi:bis(5'-nucleosyl)-tetraphosphatase (symmetrical)
MVRPQPRTWSRVLVCAGLPLTAAFVFWGEVISGGFYRRDDDSSKRTVVSPSKEGVIEPSTQRPFPLDSNKTSSLSGSTKDFINCRAKNTMADLYYKKHGKLPLPSIMHLTLPPKSHIVEKETRKNILVVGDVHGCFEELRTLHEKALQENDNAPFANVILVGDMCNKGPESARVVRFVRSQDRWLSVRGNHDDAALAAALGDKDRRKKKKYKWVMEGESGGKDVPPCNSSQNDLDDRVTLSDEDVSWLSELPYSITIPATYFGEDEDIVIVHGGFIPGQEVKSQEIETMITVREVLPVCDDAGHDDVIRFEFHERKKGKEAILSKDTKCLEPCPWASVWNGPQRVIFGHDARRGLQRYKGDWAIGLDTGAVYGKQLTGIILPERKLVSIETNAHSVAAGSDD